MYRIAGIKLYVIEELQGKSLKKYWAYEDKDKAIRLWETLKACLDTNYSRHTIDKTDQIITCYTNNSPVRTLFRRYKMDDMKISFEE